MAQAFAHSMQHAHHVCSTNLPSQSNTGVTHAESLDGLCDVSAVIRNKTPLDVQLVIRKREVHESCSLTYVGDRQDKQ